MYAGVKCEDEERQMREVMRRAGFRDNSEVGRRYQQAFSDMHDKYPLTTTNIRQSVQKTHFMEIVLPILHIASTPY